MSDNPLFLPPRRYGLIFHIAALALLVAGTAWGLWRAAYANIGPIFLLYQLPAFLAIIAGPILAYRAYALQSAYYAIEREGIHLRWGLRVEDIPVNDILWVHPASDLTFPLPLPWLRWPGAVLGIRRMAGIGDEGQDYEMEFLASTAQDLILIGTSRRIFAISPAETQAFELAFQRLTEMGSLAPMVGRSVYPTFLLNRVWQSKLARILLLGGFALSLTLVVWVSLIIAAQSEIPLGFHPDGTPGDLTPSVRLMLLPIVSTFFFLADTFLGLFLFRRQDSQPMSYLVWGSGVITLLLFMAAVFLILRAA